MKARYNGELSTSTILYGSLYTYNAESSSVSLPVFNPITDDHFQILLLGFVPDVRKNRIVRHKSCAHIMTVLLEELAINREAVLVGELTAEMNSRSRIALAEGMNLPKRGEVMGEVFGQLIEIILPPRTPAHRANHLSQTLPDVGIIRVFHGEPAQCWLFLDDVHLPGFASPVIEVLKDIPVKRQVVPHTIIPVDGILRQLAQSKRREIGLGVVQVLLRRQIEFVLQEIGRAHV